MKSTKLSGLNNDQTSCCFRERSAATDRDYYRISESVMFRRSKCVYLSSEHPKLLNQ